MFMDLQPTGGVTSSVKLIGSTDVLESLGAGSGARRRVSAGIDVAVEIDW